MKRTLTLFVSSALCAAVISSCSKTETKTTANVLIVQASPSVPTTRITTDETAPYTSQLLYGMNTGYIRMESGNRNIKMLLNDTSTLTTAMPLEAGKYYSLFLLDTGTKVSTVGVSDDLTQPAGNKARLRFLNLSPNAVPVDVVITRPDTSIHLPGDTLYRQIEFRGQTSGFNDMNPGVYTMVISRNSTHDTVCSVPTFSLSAGKIYTLYLKGYDSTSGKFGASSSLIQHN